jgi:hypothetical protein
VLTRSDDFNAMVAAELRGALGHGHVWRVAPHPDDPHLLPPSVETGILGGPTLTFEELDRRFAAGARFVSRHPLDENGTTDVVLFSVTPDGRLRAGTDGDGRVVARRERLIVLAP